MRLTADLDIGKQNLVANYAHQMGVSNPRTVRASAIQDTDRKSSMLGAFIMNIKTQLGGLLSMLLLAAMSSVLQTSNARNWPTTQRFHRH